MQRVAFVMRVKEGQQEEYIRRHHRFGNNSGQAFTK